MVITLNEVMEQYSLSGYNPAKIAPRKEVI
jgi:hypothetical protein